MFWSSCCAGLLGDGGAVVATETTLQRLAHIERNGCSAVGGNLFQDLSDFARTTDWIQSSHADKATMVVYSNSVTVLKHYNIDLRGFDERLGPKVSRKQFQDGSASVHSESGLSATALLLISGLLAP
jgi:hypothetical protein